jgi:hypothetical protein
MHRVARGDLCPHGHVYTITVHTITVHRNYESRPDRMAGANPHTWPWTNAIQAVG